MPIEAFSRVSQIATKLDASDLNIVAYIGGTQQPQITTLAPAQPRNKQDAIAVHETTTIDGKELTVGLWYWPEDYSAGSVGDLVKLPGTSLGAGVPSVVWPGDNGSTQIGRLNAYYSDQTIVTTTPTELEQEYSVWRLSVPSTATEAERNSATGTVQHWVSIDDGTGNFIWTATKDSIVGLSGGNVRFDWRNQPLESLLYENNWDWLKEDADNTLIIRPHILTGTARQITGNLSGVSTVSFRSHTQSTTQILGLGDPLSSAMQPDRLYGLRAASSAELLILEIEEPQSAGGLTTVFVPDGSTIESGTFAIAPDSSTLVAPAVVAEGQYATADLDGTTGYTNVQRYVANAAADAWLKQNATEVTRVAADLIGSLIQLSPLDDQGNVLTNDSWVARGILPLVNGFRVTDGATTNPAFAKMHPTFVSGDDLLVPSGWNGANVRNMGGLAAAFGSFQADATAVNGLRVSAGDQNAVWSRFATRFNDGGNTWSNSRELNQVNPLRGDNETRMAGYALRFGLILDSYSVSLAITAVQATRSLDETIATPSDNEFLPTSKLKLRFDALEAQISNIGGQWAGTASTYAALPTTINGTAEAISEGDIADLLVDDIGTGTASAPQYPRGRYRVGADGATYTFLHGLSGSVTASVMFGGNQIGIASTAEARTFAIPLSSTDIELESFTATNVLAGSAFIVDRGENGTALVALQATGGVVTIAATERNKYVGATSNGTDLGVRLRVGELANVQVPISATTQQIDSSTLAATNQTGLHLYEPGVNGFGYLTFTPDGVADVEISFTEVTRATELAADMIGTLMEMSPLDDQGNEISSDGWVLRGILPLVAGFRVADGATNNPIFAKKHPTFVDNSDLLVPSGWDGANIRNMGGLAATFGTFQADATAANGLSIANGGLHRHTLRGADGGSGTSLMGGWGDRIGNRAAIADACDRAGNHSHSISGDNETRMAGYALRFGLILDSYAGNRYTVPSGVSAATPITASITLDGAAANFAGYGTASITAHELIWEEFKVDLTPGIALETIAATPATVQAVISDSANGIIKAFAPSGAGDYAISLTSSVVTSAPIYRCSVGNSGNDNIGQTNNRFNLTDAVFDKVYDPDGMISSAGITIPADGADTYKILVQTLVFNPTTSVEPKVWRRRGTSVVEIGSGLIGDNSNRIGSSAPMIFADLQGGDVLEFGITGAADNTDNIYILVERSPRDLSQTMILPTVYPGDLGDRQAMRQNFYWADEQIGTAEAAYEGAEYIVVQSSVNANATDAEKAAATQTLRHYIATPISTGYTWTPTTGEAIDITTVDRVANLPNQYKWVAGDGQMFAEFDSVFAGVLTGAVSVDAANNNRTGELQFGPDVFGEIWGPLTVGNSGVSRLALSAANADVAFATKIHGVQREGTNRTFEIIPGWLSTIGNDDIIANYLSDTNQLELRAGSSGGSSSVYIGMLYVRSRA